MLASSLSPALIAAVDDTDSEDPGGPAHERAAAPRSCAPPPTTADALPFSGKISEQVMGSNLGGQSSAGPVLAAWLTNYNEVLHRVPIYLMYAMRYVCLPLSERAHHLQLRVLTWHLSLARGLL